MKNDVQALIYNLRIRADIRERAKSIEWGEPDQLVALLREAADALEAQRDYLERFRSIKESRGGTALLCTRN